MSARSTTPRDPQRRAFWLKTLHEWHWISSAICLIGLLLFSVTGITLNHAGQIESKPRVTTRQDILPPSLLRLVQAAPPGDDTPLPASVADWLAAETSVNARDRAGEWSDDEVYVSLPRPGGDAWLSIDRASGEIEYERTDRGWIAWLNDLHKGRNTGAAWGWFIDVFALASLVFTVTGLFLLQMHAGRRPATWPMVGLGLVLPLLLVLLFMH